MNITLLILLGKKSYIYFEINNSHKLFIDQCFLGGSNKIKRKFSETIKQSNFWILLGSDKENSGIWSDLTFGYFW